MSKHSRPFFTIYLAIFIFIALLLIGAGGYMILEGYTFLEAIYMTVITVASVGFGEVKPLDTAGRVFTIFLILANIGTFTYFITQVSSYFLDGEFIKEYKLMKMKKELSELEGHIIICGYGRNGHEAARTLAHRGVTYVVIERNSDFNDTHEDGPAYYLDADATKDESLLEAGILKASALISTLPDDADNVFVVLTAKELNPAIKIISRASHDTSVKKLKTAGATNVIMPDKIGGAHMANLCISPDIKEFIDLMATQNGDEFKIIELDISKETKLSDLDAWNKTGATILGLKHGADFTLNPPKDAKLKSGMKVIAMGTSSELSNLATLV
jgi:voltage-gated potassium channel